MVPKVVPTGGATFENSAVVGEQTRLVDQTGRQAESIQLSTPLLPTSPPTVDSKSPNPWEKLPESVLTPSGALPPPPQSPTSSLRPVTSNPVDFSKTMAMPIISSSFPGQSQAVSSVVTPYRSPMVYNSTSMMQSSPYGQMSSHMPYPLHMMRSPPYGPPSVPHVPQMPQVFPVPQMYKMPNIDFKNQMRAYAPSYKNGESVFDAPGGTLAVTSDKYYSLPGVPPRRWGGSKKKVKYVKYKTKEILGKKIQIFRKKDKKSKKEYVKYKKDYITVNEYIKLAKKKKSKKN